MEKCDIETDNIITGKKENSNSEKVCLDDVKVKSEGNNNFRKKNWIQCKNTRDTYLTLFNAVVVRKNRIFNDKCETCKHDFEKGNNVKYH